MLLRVDAWVPLHQCGTEVTSSTEPRRAEGLLTERGGSHPGSADEAAENPERERCCPAACSQRHHHPSPLGQRILQSSLQRCSPPLRGVLERNWSVLRCKRKPSSSCFLSSPLTRSGFQFWAGSSSKGGAVLLSPPCGSGLLLWEPVKCQGKKFKPRRNRRGEREEGTDTYPALSSGKKKYHERTRGGNLESTEPAGENRSELCVQRCCCCHCGRTSAPVATGQPDSEGFPVGCQLPV